MARQRFCPNCGSKDVEPDFSDAAYVGGAGGNPNSWECKNCGFTGLMPEQDPEEDSEESKPSGGNSTEAEKDEIEFKPGDEYRRFSTGFGVGELKFYIYVLIPALLLYIAYLTLIN